MLKSKKYMILVVGAISVLALALGGAAFASTRIASAQTDSPLSRPGTELSFPGPGVEESGVPILHGPGVPGGGRFPGQGPDNTYLAQALGISVEELQAAYQAAWQNGIDQALEQGLLTEAQAEWMKEGGSGPRGKGSWLGGWLKDNQAMDMEALLANELGITVEELQAARASAADAALQDAIDSGDITQEQADLIKARQAFKGYIEPGELEAEALGMTVEELQAARAEGKFIPDLIEEQGLTQGEFQDAVRAAYENQIQQAVADGVITQAQADLLLDAEIGAPNGLPPFGQDGGPGGRHP